uniref:Uncharacterized protein n=1 Tax=viral metagenome TaxID=1070528 RepID=A0A6M3M8Y4_9ZZZZ
MAYGKEVTELKIVCAWCGKDRGSKDGEGLTGTTHSICPDCKKKHFPKNRKMAKGQDAQQG